MNPRGKTTAGLLPYIATVVARSTLGVTPAASSKLFCYDVASLHQRLMVAHRSVPLASSARATPVMIGAEYLWYQFSAPIFSSHIMLECNHWTLPKAAPVLNLVSVLMNKISR